MRGRHRAQATLELALSVPLLLVVLLALVDVGRITQAQGAVRAVAYETARVCASAPSGLDCLRDGLARGHQVAAGYNLEVRQTQIELEAGAFERGGTAVARVRYPVALLGGAGGAALVVTAQASHSEMIDLYRSRYEASP